VYKLPVSKSFLSMATAASGGGQSLLEPAY
jgi:hypothetical protein